jgi:hypothetical protein
MRRLRKVVPLLSAGVIAVACGSAREVEVHSAASPQLADSVYVQVTNDHFADARLYAIYDGGARYPLGLISGKSKGPLQAILWNPRPLMLEISFIAEPGLYYTEDLMLERGDVVQITIPPNIATSAFFRRP